MKVTKKLDFYLLKELLIPLLICTVALVLLFQANFLIFIFKKFQADAVPLDALGKLILLQTPEFLQMTLLIASALATALAMSRLSRESELVAMQSAGIPLRRILAPFIVVGILLGVGYFYVNEKLLPTAKQMGSRLLVEIAEISFAPEFKSNVIQDLGDYTVSVGSVSRSSKGSILLDDVMMFERPHSGEMWLYTAKSGQYRDGKWRLQSPNVWMLKNAQFVSARPRRELLVNEPIRLKELADISDSASFSTEDLRAAINYNRARRKDTRQYEISYYSKYSIPFGCILFAILSPLVAMRLAKKGPFVGVLISVVAILAYFNLLLFSFQILADRRWINPLIIAWVPNIIIAVLGIASLKRLAK